MAMRPFDVSWLRGEYSEEYYGFITSVPRLNRWLPASAVGGRTSYRAPSPTTRITTQALGSLSASPPSATGRVFDPDWLGTREDVITKLSEGTRLVPQAALGIEDMDYFSWCEDGEIRFAWGGDDGGHRSP
ncbi:hypothetical protein FH608_042745 [Nonomuraea phyllanthi]|uniref:Uncharacterized protein n=1 Tax=Nonomuraea phyllanthi TaxID=2219224 RepID=A0A5C4VHS3_9ACTN|nr:DUF6461 domain-containing protein [Nonomuraea phyllanthi]KAB8188801.1 hypothetical protein FH608_042745 [Nonomuraea phyllanthi]